jgi:S1-C subfamily serine protease
MLDMDSTQATPTTVETKPTRRWPYLLAAALVFAGGIGIGSFVGLGDRGAQLPVVTRAAQSSDPAEPPVAVDSVEPVADVAEALLPSMVQIEIGVGLGSGVIFDSEGLILTAAHVVEGADVVTVRLFDGDRVEGIVVGRDDLNDVAVIRIDRTGLPAALLALDDDPRVGQLAVALGSPWGLEETVTSGVVSGVDRLGRGLIQTDASINPGNSGGALADRRGRVIGINVEIFSDTGANQGVGFAVPIKVAYGVASKLVAGEPIETAFLGISGAENEIGEGGALISEIVPGSGAEAAGLQVGDLVIAIDGEEISSMTELASRIRSAQPGDDVHLTVVRAGNSVDVTVTLGVRAS